MYTWYILRRSRSVPRHKGMRLSFLRLKVKVELYMYPTQKKQKRLSREHSRHQYLRREAIKQ